VATGQEEQLDKRPQPGIVIARPFGIPVYVSSYWFIIVWALNRDASLTVPFPRITRRFPAVPSELRPGILPHRAEWTGEASVDAGETVVRGTTAPRGSPQVRCPSARLRGP
jgi:hypothetical protein